MGDLIPGAILQIQYMVSASFSCFLWSVICSTYVPRVVQHVVDLCLEGGPMWRVVVKGHP